MAIQAISLRPAVTSIQFERTLLMKHICVSILLMFAAGQNAFALDDLAVSNQCSIATCEKAAHVIQLPLGVSILLVVFAFWLAFYLADLFTNTK
jgi:hypothetical protein